jgi:hypothetical protein
MVGILQIIFGGHPVAGLARIARELTVFLQQLRRIPALPRVEPVAHVTPLCARNTAATAAATTAAAASPPAASLSISHRHRFPCASVTTEHAPDDQQAKDDESAALSDVSGQGFRSTRPARSF